jgi:copper chaperone
MKEEILRITGMHCSGCVRSVTNALLRVKGVMYAEVSLAEKSAKVQFDESEATLEKMNSQLNEIGYRIEVAL